jgi:uncharacterized membrane protein YfcA
MKREVAAFTGGAAIGILGGLIGLGGAEFRLPLLMEGFRFAALEAVMLNKAMSIMVVAFALPSRAQAVPFHTLVSHAGVVINLLCGTLIGAWVGAGWATQLKSQILYRVIALLLVAVALVLMLGHVSSPASSPLFTGGILPLAGAIAGFFIGVFASLIGVAGGELLIPAIVLLYGLDVKVAGSLSLAISLPTMLTAFTRYSKDKSFTVIRQNVGFVLIMAGGSVTGAVVGGKLLGVVPGVVLIPVLAFLLLASACKIWRHRS